MTKPSSNSRLYTRFIPSEEVGDVTQWQFRAMGASHEEMNVAVAVLNAQQ